MKQILDTVEKKMNKVLDNLDANLRTIRTGRANANMLERVSVPFPFRFSTVSRAAASPKPWTVTKGGRRPFSVTINLVASDL